MSNDGDAFDERRRALEEQYFERKNQEALARLQNRAASTPRLSPVTGEPMETVTIMGVVVDRCPTSGGIFLDAGELEEIIKHATSDAGKGNFLQRFMGSMFAPKK